MDIYEESIQLHKKLKGKIALKLKSELKTHKDLSLLYTPGVAAPSQEIAKDINKVWEYTSRGNWVAIVTDGTAVLGLGDIGPEAAIPVMEGKALLYKVFADVDAFPISLNTKDTEEIIQVVKAISPSFGAIHLEDISAPRCFEIEQRLHEELNIPVFHDDQHATAIVAVAGVINALKITQRTFEDARFVMSGAGAAGVAVTKLLLEHGVRNILCVDSQGIISKQRQDLNAAKQDLAKTTNPNNIDGDMATALRGADVFIGVSVADVVTEDMVRSMNTDPIVIAMANPTPEIMPEKARAAGAAIVATGRSDYPNQVNNVLAFPGLMRGVLDAHISSMKKEMYTAAAHALADYVENPTPEKIIPDVLDKNVVAVVANAVQRVIQQSR